MEEKTQLSPKTQISLSHNNNNTSSRKKILTTIDTHKDSRCQLLAPYEREIHVQPLVEAQTIRKCSHRLDFPAFRGSISTFTDPPLTRKGRKERNFRPFFVWLRIARE